MNKEDIYISRGKRPWWQLLIAAFLYTLSFYQAYLFFKLYNLNIDKNYKGLAGLIQIAILTFAGGIAFSRIINYQFNLKDKSYRIIYSFGVISFGKNYTFDSLDYIAVYTNFEEVTKLNLWYNTNKHFTITTFDDPKAALQEGIKIAKKMNLDLWDATDAHNGFWRALDS